MLEMKVFQEKLEQIMERAKARGRNLTNDEIMEVFGPNQLSLQQMQSLYEYFRIQGIRIQGVELKKVENWETADAGQEEKNGPAENRISLHAEDKACLEEYRNYLKGLKAEKAGERESLLVYPIGDEAKGRLAQLYLSYILTQARELYREGCLMEDLIQEGNITLLLALSEELPEEGTDAWVKEQIRRGMKSWVDHQTEQKHQDEYLVEKVQSLEAAILELTGEEDGKYSVEELSAFLDIDEEEIRSILSLTSEGEEEKE